MKQNDSIPSTVNAGFTIVELMIATAVFSIILLVITVGVLRFTHDYFRGVNSSTTQNAARTVMDTVSQSIQFGSQPPTAIALGPGYNGAKSYCVGGNQQFVYYLGEQVDPASGQHGLLHIQSAACSANPVLSNGVELLQPHMHLAVFDINPIDATNTTWNVDIKIAYADNDSGNTNSLLCTPTVNAGSCEDANSTIDLSTSTPAAQLDDLHCKLQTGAEFCSVIGLSTTVDRRLAGG